MSSTFAMSSLGGMTPTQESTTLQYSDNLVALQEETRQIEQLNGDFLFALHQKNRDVMDRLIRQVFEKTVQMKSTVEKMKSMMVTLEAPQREENERVLDGLLAKDLTRLEGMRHSVIKANCTAILESILSCVAKHPLDHVIFRSLERLDREANKLPSAVAAGIRQEARVKIASDCIEKDAEGLEQNFAQLGILSEDDRQKLAESSVRKHPEKMALFIRNFDMTNENFRFVLASSCLEKAPHAFAEHSNNFDLSEEHRSILARRCVEILPAALAENIHVFELSDESIKMSLAERCVQLDVFLLARNIKKFGISSEKVRLQLAKDCATKNIQSVQFHFHNFGIENEALKDDLFEFCLQLGEANMLERISRCSIVN